MTRFWILDVFAEEKYAGNQLAVVLDEGRFDSPAMQQVAREMAFSETSFVEPKRDAQGHWRVRIFTPALEIPFAGHPTLGSAWLVRQELASGSPSVVTLELGVGSVEVSFSDGVVWMQPPTPRLGPELAGGPLARLLGLEPGDLSRELPVCVASVGIEFTLVPLASLEAVQRATYRLDVLRDLGEARGFPSGIFFFATETLAPENQIHARLFAPEQGVAEDPATGSANACLAAYLLRYACLGPGPVSARVEQGIEMGRPSLLRLTAEEGPGGAHVRVGGQVMLSARGELV